MDPNARDSFSSSPSAVILGILENLTLDSKKEDELRIVQELDRATEVHLTRYLLRMDSPSKTALTTFPHPTALPNFGALSRALQQRPFLRLETIILSDTLIEEKEMLEFSQAIKKGNLGRVFVLKLVNCGLRAPAAKHLADAIESGKLSCLHTLHLESNDIGDVGLYAIAGALAGGHVPALKSLHLGPKTDGFKLEGAEALGLAFTSGHLATLEDLMLQRLVEEKGLITIMRALETGVRGCLKSLCVWGSTLGVEGARAIASALMSHFFYSLLSLDLSFNKMGDEGLIALSGAFRSNNLNNLQVLTLNSIGMGEKGLLEMASLLEEGHLHSLRILSVVGSENTNTSANALIRAYRNNTFLVSEIQVKWPTKTMESNVERFMKRNDKLVDLLKD
ncbi:hypothetical protein R1sor_007926 [Riccia sorocarpa]|uniref:Uncharacterized protein n=1 Tax=Riccia sorocarpa TaxID=122646 RepID=A0ABD3HRW5_9MARC